MSEDKQEKDKDLERYFGASKERPVPPKILQGYTDEVMSRVSHRSGLWHLGWAIPLIAVVSLVAWAFWHGLQKKASDDPESIVRDLVVIEQVSPIEEIISLPQEEILLQMEMMDTLMIAMNDTTGSPLNEEDEAAVLLSVDPSDSDVDQDSMDVLDEMEILGSVEQA